LNIKRALTLTVLTMLVLTFIPLKTTEADPVKVYVSPTPPLVSTAAPGQNFTIQIRIAESPPIYLWIINLEWNSTILNCTDVTEGPFLKAGGRKTLFAPTSPDELEHMINNTAGALRALCGFLGEPREAQVSGSGILAYCTFQVKKPGETILNLTTTELTNFDAIKTYPENLNGLFVYPVAVLEIPKILDGSKTTGKSVTVDINTINIQELKGFEFKLNYTTNVLEAKEVELKPFSQPNINYTNINATAGYVSINVTSYGTAQPVSGNRTLATVTFEVKKDHTACALNLFDVKINATGYVASFTSYFTNVVHDVAVKIDSASPESEVTVGNPVEITVTAENKPWATQNETFTFEVLAGINAVGTETVENLSPGGTKQVELTWNTTDLVTDKAVNYDINVRTDTITEIISDVLVEEKNTTDNQFRYGNILVKPLGGIIGIPMEYLAAGIIAVVIVIVVVVVYLRRRKRT